MEIKWVMIGFAVIFGMMFMGIGVDQYQKGQCRIAAIQSNMTPELIEKVCK